MLGKFNKKIKGFVFDYYRRAKSISYGDRRSKKDIMAVVLHWTEGTADSSQNECDFFATGNTRSAGAHIFIDRLGRSGFSIPLKYSAYAVMSKGYSYGTYAQLLDNTNTVSVELCGCNDGKGNGLPMTEVQEKKLYEVIRWIKKQCPNVTIFCRHYDIRKKPCPLYYVENSDEWRALKRYVERCLL